MPSGNFSIQVKPEIAKTTVKYSPEFQASQIEDEKLKFDLEHPKRLEIKWFEIVGNHYKFELEEPINGRYVWYAFEQHVDAYDDNSGNLAESSTIINVPYFSQRDNAERPGQTCNMTCSAMVVEFFYPGTDQNTPGQLEDAMTRYCTSQWGHDAIYYHNRIVDTLAHWRVKSTFDTNTPFSKIKQHLQSGKPVIYSGKFTGSGHIIVLRGYDDTGFWVNDPWGEWFPSGYQNKSGEKLHYSYRMISSLSYSGSSAGWAHLCEKL